MRISPLLHTTALPAAGFGLLILFAPSLEARQKPGAQEPVKSSSPAESPVRPIVPGALVQADQPPLGGPRIGEILVKGNKKLNTDYVISQGRHKIGDPCTDQALSEIRTNLYRTGYFGYKLDPEDAVKVHAEEFNPPNGRCRVVIEVAENEAVKGVSVTGAGPIKPEQITPLLKIKAGDVYSPLQFNSDVQDIQALYNKQGYVVSFDQTAGLDDKGILNVPIIVARVSEIKLNKLRKTRRNVVLRAIKTKEGDYFNANTLYNRDRVRLYNLDLFEEVVVEDRSLGPGRVGITISLPEKRTGTVSVGVGYSNRQQLVGHAEVTETNFRGTGETVNLLWETGGAINRNTIELGFTEPWLDRKETSLSVQLYDKAIFRFANTLTGGSSGLPQAGTDTRYNEQRTGGALTVSRPFADNRFRAALTGRAENVRVDPLALSGVNTAILQNGPIYSVTGTLINNTRDLDLDPVNGGYRVLSVEGGHANLRSVAPPNTAPPPSLGSINFVKTALDARQYFSPTGPRNKAKLDAEKSAFALRMLVGVSTGTLPFFEQFFVGGAESLRGYREDRFWGKWMFLSSIEYRQPLARKLKGVLFLDAGSAWGGSYTGLNIEGFKQEGRFRPHLGVGAGIRVGTPLGPIRLDFGFGEEGGRTHFSIGHVF